MGFVVDKAALGQVFSENFGFPCKSVEVFLLNNISASCCIEVSLVSVCNATHFSF
jgi:hypothetical protein